jgi:hypothetical protein
MALEVYYPQDILNALLAAEQSAGAAIQAADSDNLFMAGYQAGYHAALVTISLAFGLTRHENNKQHLTFRLTLVDSH